MRPGTWSPVHLSDLENSSRLCWSGHTGFLSVQSSASDQQDSDCGKFDRTDVLGSSTKDCNERKERQRGSGKQAGRGIEHECTGTWGDPRRAWGTPPSGLGIRTCWKFLSTRGTQWHAQLSEVPSLQELAPDRPLPHLPTPCRGLGNCFVLFPRAQPEPCQGLSDRTRLPPRLLWLPQLLPPSLRLPHLCGYGFLSFWSFLSGYIISQ